MSCGSFEDAGQVVEERFPNFPQANLCFSVVHLLDSLSWNAYKINQLWDGRRVYLVCELNVLHKINQIRLTLRVKNICI